MKSFLSLFFIVIFSLFTLQNHSAQWKQTTGPAGGRICSIVSDGNYTYAATFFNGIFRSDDNGQSWTLVNNGLVNSYGQPVQDIRSLLIRGNDIFAGSLMEGLFKSSDKGNSWKAVNNGLIYDSSPLPVTALAVSGDNILAGGSARGVFISSNGGLNWSVLNNNFDHSEITVLFSQGGVIFMGTGGSGVFRSTDNGQSWSEANNGLTYKYVFSIASIGTTIIAGTGMGMFTSDDNGLIWKKVEGEFLDILDIKIYKGKIYVGDFYNGVFVSEDNAKSWRKISTDQNIKSVTSLGVTDSLIIAGTYQNGIYSSTDNGSSWRRSGKGPVIAHVEALLTDGDDLYAGTIGGEVFYTSDNGQNWKTVPRGWPFTGSLVTSLAKCEGNILAAITGIRNVGGIYISSDKGATWKAANNNQLIGTSVNTIAVNGTDIYVGSTNGINHSTNLGASWDTLNNGLTDKSTYLLAFHGKDLFASTFKGLFISTNNGSSWTLRNQGMPEALVSSFTSIDSNIFVSSGSDVPLFRSTDKGLSWKPLGKSITKWGALSVIAAGKNLFMGTTSDRLYLSTDLGETWKLVNDGQTGLTIVSLAVNDKYIYAGTKYNGVFVRNLSDMITTSADEDKVSLPGQYSLYQNYPNPFNPVTTIRYSLPFESDVYLKVYDMLGREVKTLIDKRVSAGEHKVQFNASELPSGVYIYKLQCGSYLESRKMILIK